MEKWPDQIHNKSEAKYKMKKKKFAKCCVFVCETVSRFCFSRIGNLYLLPCFSTLLYNNNKNNSLTFEIRHKHVYLLQKSSKMFFLKEKEKTE